jgi:DNA polymerase IV
LPFTLRAQTRSPAPSDGITLVGCSVVMLEAERPRQLLLGPEEALDAAVDAVRDPLRQRGDTRAVLLGRNPGFSMPLLPD